MDTNPNHLFTITQGHIDLLKYAQWHWNTPNISFKAPATITPIGAPAINCAMPFGHQFVDADQICRCLQWTTASSTFGNYSESQRERALQIWRETLYALQIICTTQSFEKGNYQFDENLNRWFKVKEEQIFIGIQKHSGE